MAIRILEKYKLSRNVIAHSITVSELAMEIAMTINRKNNTDPINLKYVKIGALLHDIGRCVTHTIFHGIEGAKILRKIAPEYANVAENHIGAGISRKDALKLGLPDKDYIPKNIEEKIIAYADNLVYGDEIKDVDWVESRFSSELGENSEAFFRIRKMNWEMEKLLGIATIERILRRVKKKKNKIMELLPEVYILDKERNYITLPDIFIKNRKYLYFKAYDMEKIGDIIIYYTEKSNENDWKNALIKYLTEKLKKGISTLSTVEKAAIIILNIFNKEKKPILLRDIFQRTKTERKITNIHDFRYFILAARFLEFFKIITISKNSKGDNIMIIPIKYDTDIEKNYITALSVEATELGLKTAESYINSERLDDNDFTI